MSDKPPLSDSERRVVKAAVMATCTVLTVALWLGIGGGLLALWLFPPGGK